MSHMDIITSISEMQAKAAELKASGKRIGFVPTMGALHEGHLSLIKLAGENADAVVVSIFVNPTQFGPAEDFSKYPRERESDLKKCEEAGVCVVFVPEASEFYPEGYSTYVAEEAVSKPLEGVSRPIHFRGVTTVLVKLFNIVCPDIVVMGQKDAQQVAVVQKMVEDLCIRTQILVGPTQRESDGLALSSRNRYLSPMQRKDALCIHAALEKAKDMVAKGERRVDRIEAEATHLMSEYRRVRVIYVSVVNRKTMAPIKGALVPGECLIAIAAWVDEVRLIDNELL